jgi:alkylhydroperoxidase family enzyme
MEARMKNPAMIIDGAMGAIQSLARISRSGGVPNDTLDLVHLRVSQINGCAACIAGTSKQRPDDRFWSLPAWRDAPYYSDAERAALALAEYATRLADRDREDAVPDAVWDEATRHYDEAGMASLLLTIAVTNLFNRLNVPTRQVPGQWG